MDFAIPLPTLATRSGYPLRSDLLERFYGSAYFPNAIRVASVTDDEDNGLFESILDREVDNTLVRCSYIGKFGTKVVCSDS